MHPVEGTIKGMGFPRVGQIGIVVSDTGKMLPQYAGLLGVNPWFRTRTAGQEIYYGGKKIDLELDLILGYSGRMQVELIGVLSGEESIYSDILRRGGGLHHLGFFVTDFDRRLEKVKAAGIEVLQQGRINTRGGTITRFAYLDTLGQCGVILELIESKLKGRLPVPQTRFMMGIGSKTGDVEKMRC